MSSVATTVGTRRPQRARTAARRTRRLGLPALVAALLIGIFGMHALTSHGSPATHPAAASSMSPMSPMNGTPSHHDAGIPAAASTDASGGSGHDLSGMVMLCVVMLAAAALTLLALLVVGFFRPLRPAAFLPVAARERTVQWVRGTGPPSVWQFSVIRC